MPYYHNTKVFEGQKRLLGYSPEFKLREIRKFFENYIEGNPCFRDNYLIVLVNLLEIMEEHGRCPSVVSATNKEPELGYDRYSYGCLSKIPLFWHSTNVAAEFMRISESDLLCRSGFIAAIGHDIGKIPIYYGKQYSTGDHALISVNVLMKIEKFSTLKTAEDILHAIRDHHGNPTSLVAKYLQKADQAARRAELSDFGPEIDSSDTTNHVKSNSKSISGGSKTSDALLGFHEPLPSAKVDLMGLNPSDFVECSNINLHWLDSADLLNHIDTLINGITNGKWQAISLENHVYVRPEALISLAEKLSRNCTEFQVAKTSNQSRMDLMFSMIDQLRKDFNAIDTTMVGPKFFGTKFNVKTGGHEKEMFLIPLHIHVFGRLPSELHRRKSSLHLSVEWIKPKRNNGGAL
jgi:HD domain